ncbi:MAG: glycosyltransferase family 4 protein [bacterium]
MKKILLISCDYPPAIGGVSTVAKDIISNLSTTKYNVSLLTHYIKGREIDNINNIFEIKFSRYVWILKYWNFIRKIKSSDYDVIILNGIAPNALASLFFSEILQRKCISYLHGSEPEYFYKNIRFSEKIFGIKNKYMKLMLNAKNIVAVSEYMKKKYLEFSKMKNIQDKIKIIYNAIDKNVYFKEEIDLLKEHNLKKGTYILLTVSRIVRKKGFDEKYEIFKKLIQKGEKFHWFIIGDGLYLSRFKKLVIEEGYQEHISFLGGIKDKNILRRYYSSVDAFWLLSNFDEALGLVYIESLACGTPVIAKNNAGVKEIIENNLNGFLIDNNDQCLEILKRKSFLSLDKENFESSISKFNININKELLIQIIES